MLHNYLRNENDNNTNIDRNVDIMPRNQLLPIQRTNSSSALNASTMRQRFTTYLNTVGKVSWQEESIVRGKF